MTVLELVELVGHVSRSPPTAVLSFVLPFTDYLQAWVLFLCSLTISFVRPFSSLSEAVETSCKTFSNWNHLGVFGNKHLLSCMGILSFASWSGKICNPSPGKVVLRDFVRFHDFYLCDGVSPSHVFAVLLAIVPPIPQGSWSSTAFDNFKELLSSHAVVLFCLL